MIRKDRGYASAIAVVVVAVVILAVSGMFMATSKTDQSVIGLSYGGGPFEGRKFQQVLNPGTGMTFTGWFDPLYTYPVTQRSYIISKAEGDVQGVVTAPSKNNIPVFFEVATYFKLNLDRIQAFHEDLGLKYRAWEDAGWDKMLAETFKQQIEGALQKEARAWDDSQLYSSQETLLQVAGNVGRTLKEQIEQVIGDEYFCGVEYIPGGDCSDFTFVIKTVDLPENVKVEYQANRESEIAVQTSANVVRQREQEAESIRTLNEALAEAGDQYVILRAIEEGKVNFWVIPSDTGLSLQTPETPTPPSD